MPPKKPDQSPVTPSSGKLIPPTHPVDVPNLPKKPERSGETAGSDPAGAKAGPTDAKVGADPTKPAEIDHSRSSWADSTQPAPDKRNARTSLL